MEIPESLLLYSNDPNLHPFPNSPTLRPLPVAFPSKAPSRRVPSCEEREELDRAGRMILTSKAMYSADPFQVGRSVGV
ncbi:hypothetical protein BDY24DRAFT_392520 [Mrakia frigida]|uniref:uncharacterized protein n=1 Tax=Mrakia frigida TaxID=29902 RepID=UPI003FCC1361